MLCGVTRIFFLAALAAGSAIAQADAGTPARRQRKPADAGMAQRDRPILLGTDPPGRLRPSPPAPDGGVAQRDAGPDEVHREIQQLRARIDALEQERARNQEAAQQLQQISQEIQMLRQQVADAEAQRRAAEQQEQSRRASVQSAVDALYYAQQQLAGGNPSIDAQLSQAEAAFSGQAQRDLQAARAALANRDLAAARAYLAAAIRDAQQY
jgi:hypothetical protein